MAAKLGGGESLKEDTRIWRDKEKSVDAAAVSRRGCQLRTLAI
ncbi:hypothetical protein [Nostoc sp.]